MKNNYNIICKDGICEFKKTDLELFTNFYKKNRHSNTITKKDITVRTFEIIKYILLNKISIIENQLIYNNKLQFYNVDNMYEIINNGYLLKIFLKKTEFNFDEHLDNLLYAMSILEEKKLAYLLIVILSHRDIIFLQKSEKLYLQKIKETKIYLNRIKNLV